MTTPRDDSLMSRFDEHGLRRFRARDAVGAIALTAILLVLFAGPSIRGAGERMEPGLGRTLVLVVGAPAGWVADRLPLADAASRGTAWLSPDDDLDEKAGFDGAGGAAPAAGPAVSPVTGAAFAPADIGAAPPPRRPLGTLLVTGDSLSTPLDSQVARALASTDVRVVRDPHLGTGISKTFVVDWGKLSTRQVAKLHPDAVVVFIGANEGFPMPGPDGSEVECCGADWAAVYANRVRRVTDTYRQEGAARVYWITVPTPRDDERTAVSRVVNAALDVATQPWRAQVRVVDTVPTFTPHGYRDAMSIDGRETIVREADGIHLNDTGAALLADIVVEQLRADFSY
jgi:lysophospholipase L1-like esterase